MKCVLKCIRIFNFLFCTTFCSYTSYLNFHNKELTGKKSILMALWKRAKRLFKAYFLGQVWKAVLWIYISIFYIIFFLLFQGSSGSSSEKGYIVSFFFLLKYFVTDSCKNIFFFSRFFLILVTQFRIVLYSIVHKIKRLWIELNLIFIILINSYFKRFYWWHFL